MSMKPRKLLAVLSWRVDHQVGPRLLLRRADRLAGQKVGIAHHRVALVPAGGDRDTLVIHGVNDMDQLTFTDAWSRGIC